MIWEILSDEEKNEVLLKLMVAVTKADAHIREGEFSYLIYLCQKLHINPEKIRQYVSEEDHLETFLPSSEKERMDILYHLLFTMKSDGEVHPMEENILYKLAFKLGFSEEMVRDFIELMKKYAIDTVPVQEMIDIIRKKNN
jgi:uncharacterized tellurite resistance protein B-like protein